MNTMDFSTALESARIDGRQIAREGWNGKSMFVLYINPEVNSIYSAINHSQYQLAPYYALKTVDDCIVPWQPSQTDMIAEDWVNVD